MKTVILCGGYGTRLREETEHKPKPMVAIDQKPIIWHIMKHYSHFGHKDFVLALGYKGDALRNYFLTFNRFNSDVAVNTASNDIQLLSDQEVPDWNVTLAETGDGTMTGGRLRRVGKYLGGERFMLTYGDAVSSVDIGELVKFHVSHGKLATVTGVPPIPRFGKLLVQGDQVIKFSEKPHDNDTVINGGYLVFEPEVLDLLEGDDTILEHGPLSQLASDGQLMVYDHPGFWHCMDTYRDYSHLNELAKSKPYPWQVW